MQARVHGSVAGAGTRVREGSYYAQVSNRLLDNRATSYLSATGKIAAMNRPQLMDSRVISEARAAFSAAFAILLKETDTNPTAVAAAMKRKERGKKTPSQKTLNNMLNASHPHQISNMEMVAAFFQIPLWIMLIPGLKPALLQVPYRDRLVKLMADYVVLDSEGRTAVENMASAHAALRRKSAKQDAD